MLPEKKTKTNIGVGIGIILQLAGFALCEVGETGAVVGLLLILIIADPWRSQRGRTCR